ncbi:MAG TPA: hypothetical protein PKK26_10045 [Candidatus Wallbacteria bacterium]|nr:hypothetical protein [Candidatus Wallbacteria bacterium]
MYCKKDSGKIIYAFIISGTTAFIAGAFAFAGIFDNASNAGAFKAKIKRDIFYTEEEKTNIKAALAGQQPVISVAPQPILTQAPQPVASQVNAPATAVPVEKQSQSENEKFPVEGIIKVGERGCAIINSKIWYVGKPDLGYELIKLYDEMVEIKTPDGRILKRKLVKENAGR